MDALERKVEVLTNENTDYKKKIENLEDNNASLLSQLQKLQAMVARSSGSSTTTNNNTPITTSTTTTNNSRIVRHSDSTSFTTVSNSNNIKQNALFCFPETQEMCQPLLWFSSNFVASHHVSSPTL